MRTELRAVVRQFRAREQRRGYAPVALHVGDLSGEAVTWSHRRGEWIDPALRTDVVAALLERLGQDSGVAPAAWITRAGALQPHDEDLAWAGAVHRAFAAAGLTPRCVVVVTKTGWYSPQGGERAEWKRPRRRASSG